jgi:hypothetical protein
MCWSCAFIFTSFPIVLYLEDKEKRAAEQREKERQQAAEAIAGQVRGSADGKLRGREEA